MTIDEFLEAHPEYAGENAEEYRKAYEKTFQYQSERLNFAVRTFGHEVAIGLSPFKRAIMALIYLTHPRHSNIITTTSSPLQPVTGGEAND